VGTPASRLDLLGRLTVLAGAAAGLIAAAALPVAPAGAQHPPGVPPVHAGQASAVPADIAVSAQEKLLLKRSSISSSAPAARKAVRPAARKAARLRLAAPVRKITSSSGFGYRINPVTGAAGEFHNGLDFAQACGMPVTAARGGRVVEASRSAYGYGNRLVLEHANGMRTTYNHLQAIGVVRGERVSRGEEIAAVGTTGNSTGCHLHFEVIVRGKAVDPKDWLRLVPAAP
jgi:murein DD-endopeptidase MepM/ murein hydrolase activator NlpD